MITFNGFDRLVDTLGGVDLYVDQRVASLHRRPDGKYRDPAPGGGGYTGPQMVYEKGERHLNGWQALDYARQRYITGGDYARQRHQQQLIRALAAQDPRRGPGPASPDRVEQVVAALGDTLVYVGGAADRRPGVRPRRHDRRTGSPWSACPATGSARAAAYRGEQLTSVGPEASSPSCGPAGPTPTWPPTPSCACKT